ncbi:MAG: hypothetical protein ISN26_05645 [Betaproteobacteria bacterium AqS2]|uniref:Uncharacterized protein n=1 Tax=Candidatus Amphirhobacter heronislandensis TaxID=1732024 RepID=A0A930UH21_9GAMM|nr:hypothetical protein [Betaproteobacteria bacterium AqS2]
MDKPRIIIQDDDGADYEVRDIQALHRHLLEFHQAEGTIHDEDGQLFTVTPEFREKIRQLAEEG